MKISRRSFLRGALLGTAGAGVATLGYTFVEAKWCRVTRARIAVPRLPAAFHGFRVALLTDVHHGPWQPPWYVQHVVRLCNGLGADLVCIGGDNTHKGRKYVEPAIAMLGELRAREGVLGVLGNHDHWDGAAPMRAAMARVGIRDLTNAGLWIGRAGARLRIGGVGDLWEEKQDLGAALGDATDDDASLLLSHNPDTLEEVRDPRVGLVLSGHTHGGQVVVPGFGAPLTPSAYGQKYLYGLVKTPVTQVFVSRGAGCVAPPVRLFAPPEVVEITLV